MDNRSSAGSVKNFNDESVDELEEIMKDGSVVITVVAIVVGPSDWMFLRLQCLGSIEHG